MTTIAKIALERPKNVGDKQFPWTSCAPFVENSRGTLIHRPRRASTYNLHSKPHFGIIFWCGMSVASSGKNLTFLSAPPKGRILCERCEAAAVANGLPSADDIAGSHAHKGRTVAVATCCDLMSNEKKHARKTETIRPEQIRAARIAAGLTQTQAARLVVTTYRTWHRWETGERAMSAQVWELFNLKKRSRKK